MEIIALYNLKGGVGKTTSCVNLAYAAAKEGYKTLVWDLDPQAAATFFLKQKISNNIKVNQVIEDDEIDLAQIIQDTPYQNLSLIPGDSSARHLDIILNDQKGSAKKQLKGLFRSIKKQYDFLFLDCPPGFSTLADGVFSISDIMLMPIIPTTLSIRTFNIVKDHLNKLNIDDSKLMCFFNLVDIRKSLHIDTIIKYAADLRFFEYYIPNASEIERMGTHMSPLLEKEPNSRGGQSFQALWQEIKEGVIV